MKNEGWDGCTSKPVLRDEERTRCEVWTRVMGYHRPVESYNIGKKAEFAQRKYFVEDKAKRLV